MSSMKEIEKLIVAKFIGRMGTIGLRISMIYGGLCPQLPTVFHWRR